MISENLSTAQGSPITGLVKFALCTLCGRFEPVSGRHFNLVECTEAGIPGSASEPGCLLCRRQKSMLQSARRVPGLRAHVVL